MVTECLNTFGLKEKRTFGKETCYLSIVPGSLFSLIKNYSEKICSHEVQTIAYNVHKITVVSVIKF